MSFSLALPAPEALLELIQEKSSVPVARSDLHTIFAPIALTDHPSGRNSQITVRTTLDFSHAGRVNFQYDRLDLADVLATPMEATVDDIATFPQFLNALNNRYGIAWGLEELEPVETFNVSGGELEYAIQVRAKSDALRFIGTGTMVVNVTWRLDDPEYVEQEVDRLHQLIHYTLPASFASLNRFRP